MTLKEWANIFGENLCDLMEARKMSQQELARVSGVPIGSINSYIHRQSTPGIKAIINLSYALDVDLIELIDFGDTID
jgi:transcriptional regulator with XRE-family HTH domain